ncbi:hypothetical protein PanWU01x14_143690 [Parasponia andersonii]|uniref:Uncharacterized protein n=1 Tax=Parasponia andersonii TaxID=3476 RepID=A0A2P5CKY7_PARAD|nr:hypothetical protein PanWU01x14_143690 [Parasponia andersonii]
MVPSVASDISESSYSSREPHRKGYVEQWIASKEAAVKEVIHHGVSFVEPLGRCPSSSPVELLVLVLFWCLQQNTQLLLVLVFRKRLESFGRLQILNIKFSPFMSANKFEKPILLIHGEQYNDPRTLPMPVSQMENTPYVA